MPLNELLARAAIRGAQIKQIPEAKMCSDCAFKKGTDANNDQDAVQAAADCLVFSGKFNCHKKDFQNAEKPCAGFLMQNNFTNQ